jgi:hypothetical protein
MNLTPDESAFVERLRRAEKWWPVKRWFLLALGVMFVLIPVLLRHDPDPLFRLFPLAAGFALSYVASNWRGRFRNQIFIKLV